MAQSSEVLSQLGEVMLEFRLVMEQSQSVMLDRGLSALPSSENLQKIHA